VDGIGVCSACGKGPAAPASCLTGNKMQHKVSAIETIQYACSFGLKHERADFILE
jgi:hypothetical protein